MIRLKTRWSYNQIETINEYLQKGIEFDPPFGLIDGKIDLRGLIINRKISNVKIMDIDFSYGKVMQDSGFLGCHIENCLFFRAEIKTILKNRFINCDFRKAVLKDNILLGNFKDCLFV